MNTTIPLIIFLFFLVAGSLHLYNRRKSGYRRKIDYSQHAGPGSIGVSTIPQGPRTLLRIGSILIPLGLLIWIGLPLIQSSQNDVNTHTILPFLLFLGMSVSMWRSARDIGLLYIGPAGLVQARLSRPDRGDNEKGLVRWENVQHLEWDRDIGQRMWGLNLHYTNKKNRVYKIKLYIPRPEKDTLTELLNNYVHQEQLQEASAGNTPDE